MRAFIVRPFGTKNDIDFDAVEKKLIDPVLKRLGVTGRTTGEIIRQGNIREDMFQLLLTADLVVADLSIHNANVFYELGVRHSLRDKHTFLLRSDADKFPFDLQTDRYFTYDRSYFTCVRQTPDGECEQKVLTAEDEKAIGAIVDALYQALRDTIDSGKTNSPVFSSLPNIKEQEPSRFIAVPPGFGEEAERAAAGKQLGDLGLLAAEAKNLGFDWETEGLRTVGRAQYKLKDFKGAKNTWEAVLRNAGQSDLEANILLGTIYQRLCDLTRSTQALERALDVKGIERKDRAEVHALLARNAKTQWQSAWKELPDAQAKAATALRSGLLKESFENYERAYEQDLNHFYSGLNALAMLKVMTELAAAQPNVWAARFRNRKSADNELEELTEHATKLAAAVQLSLDANMKRLEREGAKDEWAEISVADLRCYTSDNPEWVATGYSDALAGASAQAWDSVRNQLAIYRDLGILSANVEEAIKFTGLPKPTGDAKRQRVLIFTGHMLDAPGREKPRFPADKEGVARQKIKEAVEAEMASAPGVSFGIAGGASGGDILFHEVCAELGVTTQLYLALQSPLYINASVRKAGPEWVERFRRLNTRLEAEGKVPKPPESLEAQGKVRVLSELSEEPADEAEHLPAWLRSKPEYNIWQRNNLWMLHNALAEGGDDCVTLIALWDREPTGDGPGGTSDLVAKTERRGAKTVVLPTKELFGL